MPGQVIARIAFGKSSTVVMIVVPRRLFPCAARRPPFVRPAVVSLPAGDPIGLLPVPVAEQAARRIASPDARRGAILIRLPVTRRVRFGGPVRGARIDAPRPRRDIVFRRAKIVLGLGTQRAGRRDLLDLLVRPFVRSRRATLLRPEAPDTVLDGL